MDKHRVEVRGLNGAFYEVSRSIEADLSGGVCAPEGDGSLTGAVTDSVLFCLLLGPHQVCFWKHAGSCL